MLILATLTHSEDNCPGFNHEIMPSVIKGLESREEIAKKHGVKLRGLWSGAPDHVFFVLVEADSSLAIDLFLTEAAPFKQACKLTPVITAEELVKLGKEMMARG